MNTQTQGQICKQCKGTDRYQSNGRCIVCTQAARLKYKLNNPEKVRLSDKKYRTEHPEKCRARNHDRYIKNREQCIENARQWRHQNPIAHGKSCRKWQRNNYEKFIIGQKIRNAKRRTRLCQVVGTYSLQEWNDLKNMYGNICLSCQKEINLTADHVIPVVKGGTSFIDNIQPLCRSCNSRKGTKTIDYRIKGETICQ